MGRLKNRILRFLIRRNIRRAMHHANLAEVRLDYLDPPDFDGARLAQDIAQAVALLRDHLTDE